LILHAIHEAYRNILPPAVFSRDAAFSGDAYDEVDVNVIRKIEVRFRRSQFVHDFARDAIRQALMGARPIASFAAAAATAPQFAGFCECRFRWNHALGGIREFARGNSPMEEIGVGSGVVRTEDSILRWRCAGRAEDPFTSDCICQDFTPAGFPLRELGRESRRPSATLPRASAPEQIADLKPLGKSVRVSSSR